MRFAFVVPGKPRAKLRARHTKAGGTYTPESTVKYEEEVWVCALKAGIRRGQFPQYTPLWLGVRAFFGRPAKNHTCKQHPAMYEDIDNILKAIMDGLRPAFHNDNQIVGFLLGTGKFFCHARTLPRVEVTITDVEPIAHRMAGEVQ